MDRRRRRVVALIGAVENLVSVLHFALRTGPNPNRVRCDQRSWCWTSQDVVVVVVVGDFVVEHGEAASPLGCREQRVLNASRIGAVE